MEERTFSQVDSPPAVTTTEADALEQLLPVSTSLLTIFALVATSKLWVMSLPVLLALDAYQEYKDGKSLAIG